MEGKHNHIISYQCVSRAGINVMLIRRLCYTICSCGVWMFKTRIRSGQEIVTIILWGRTGGYCFMEGFRARGLGDVVVGDVMLNSLDPFPLGDT